MDPMKNLEEELKHLCGPAPVPKAPDWRKIRIHVTASGKATDPLRSEFWRRAGWVDPLPDIHRTARDGNDRLNQRLEKVAERAPRLPEMRRRGVRSVAFDLSPLPDLPEHLDLNANARNFVAGLQSSAARSNSRHAWWKALWSYAAKFPREARVRDLDRGTLRIFLSEIQKGERNV